MSQFTVIADANVLVPVILRDLLLEFAFQGMFRVRWTPHIRDEVRRTLCGELFQLDPAKVDRLLLLMAENVLQPDVTGYELCINKLVLPDPEDRHILAAAIIAEADTIVTFNLKHFPADYCLKQGVMVTHPDIFLAAQVTLMPGPAMAAVRTIENRWRRPDIRIAGILDRCRKIGLVETAAELRKLSLDR